MRKKKIVLTVGVFDVLHIGHILLFQHARELFGGDCILIVAIQDSSVVGKYKPDTHLVYSTEERKYMVDSIRYVDKTIIYHDVDEDIRNVDFDVFVKGPDQNHSGFQKAIEWCRLNDKEVVELPRTEGISSSLLRAGIKD